MMTCKWCDGPLRDQAGTQCDNCWEVICRVRYMPADLIEKILRGLGFQARVMK
jgi:hypothetical protein